MATKPYRALPSELRWTHALARSSNRPCRVDAPPAAPRSGRSSQSTRGSGRVLRSGGATATGAGTAARPGGSPSTILSPTGTAAATTPPTSSLCAVCATRARRRRSDVGCATAAEQRMEPSPCPTARRPRQRLPQADGAPNKRSACLAGVVALARARHPAQVAVSLPFALGWLCG